MFESFITFLLNFVQEYGLHGLFISSAIGSTIFVPFSVEAVLAVLVAVDKDPVLLVLFATAGSFLGNSLNYVIGFFSFEWLKKWLLKNKKQQDNIKKADQFSNRHGWKGLFVALMLPISLPVDPLTILAGAGKMNIRIFLLVVIFGKLIKYSIVVVLLIFFKDLLLKYGLLKFLGI